MLSKRKMGKQPSWGFVVMPRYGTTIAGAILDPTIPGGMCGKETIVHLRKRYIRTFRACSASSGYSKRSCHGKAFMAFTDSIRSL